MFPIWGRWTTIQYQNVETVQLRFVNSQTYYKLMCKILRQFCKFEIWLQYYSTLIQVPKKLSNFIKSIYWYYSIFEYRKFLVILHNSMSWYYWTNNNFDIANLTCMITEQLFITTVYNFLWIYEGNLPILRKVLCDITQWKFFKKCWWYQKLHL